jgi:hypothetical protein
MHLTERIFKCNSLFNFCVIFRISWSNSFLHKYTYIFSVCWRKPCKEFTKTTHSQSITTDISSSGSSDGVWWATGKSMLHSRQKVQLLFSQQCRGLFWGPSSPLSIEYRCLLHSKYCRQGVNTITYPTLTPFSAEMKNEWSPASTHHTSTLGEG